MLDALLTWQIVYVREEQCNSGKNQWKLTQQVLQWSNSYHNLMAFVLKYALISEKK